MNVGLVIIVAAIMGGLLGLGTTIFLPGGVASKLAVIVICSLLSVIVTIGILNTAYVKKMEEAANESNTQEYTGYTHEEPIMSDSKVYVKTQGGVVEVKEIVEVNGTQIKVTTESGEELTVTNDNLIMP